jgi:hypothetical protein
LYFRDAQRRRYESQTCDRRGECNAGGDPGAKRVAGERHAPAGAERLREKGKTGANVVLLSPSPLVSTARRPDAPKVEAQRRKATGGTALDDPRNYRTVHVATIERMRMPDDDAETSAGRYGEPGFEGLVAGADGHRLLGYHLIEMRITARGLTVQPTC